MATPRTRPRNTAVRAHLIETAEQTRELAIRLEDWRRVDIQDAKIRELRAGEPHECAAWEIAEFLPMLLWQWEQHYGSWVVVTGDGEIIPA